jgi:hypothetical protein
LRIMADKKGASMFKRKKAKRVVPEGVQDPIAGRISWQPLSKANSNMRTHRLVELGPDILAFKATGGAIGFVLAFIVIAPLIAMVVLVGAVASGEGNAIVVTLCLGAAAAFATFGTVMLRFATRPRVFDGQAGWYVRSRISPRLLSRRDKTYTHGVPFDQIYALQIICEFTKYRQRHGTIHLAGKVERGYWSYELNLVLKNRKRINVVDHGDLGALLKDAEALASLLGVPIWQGDKVE